MRKVTEMGKYGPMKHPDKVGLDEIAATYGGQHIEKISSGSY